MTSSVEVYIPSPLRSYTHGESELQAAGATVGELLDDLDRQYPGIRWRMVDEQRRVRPHMRVFVNGEQTFDLGMTLRAGDKVQIIAALSGG